MGTCSLGIVYLQNNEMVEATVSADTHGQHFIIDLRALEYDSDLYIGIRKLDEFDVTLTLDVSLTVVACDRMTRSRSTMASGTR